MLRFIKIALAATIGLTIVATLVTARSVLTPIAGRESQRGVVPETPQPDELPENSGAAPTSDAVQPPDKPPAGKARNVGGGVVAVPEGTGEPLERIEPLPQPTAPAPPKATEPLKIKQVMRWRLVYNSVISAAGVFDLNGTALVLPGIDIVPTNETCTAPNGTEWPCGMVARTAFRNFVKGRAITCKVPDVPAQQAFSAECLLSGQDMAGWLVEQGWARAKTATLYVDLETGARQGQRGIFGNPPRGVEAVSKADAGLALPVEPVVNP